MNQAATFTVNLLCYFPRLHPASFLNMPELPEVEVIVSALATTVVGKVITGVEILRQSVIDQESLIPIKERLVGHSFCSISRRGKFIIFSVDNGERLLLHLRMSGYLCWVGAASPLKKETRVVFYFIDGNKLLFNDLRALGRMRWLPAAETATELARLGVEPLSAAFSQHYLTEKLLRSRLQIKDFLLAQDKIAGIGNIYASEILFASGIHPQRRGDTLKKTEIKKLFENIPQILRLALTYQGTTIANFRGLHNTSGRFQELLKVYRRQGKPCLNCGQPIRRIKQKARSSYFCPCCQH